MPFFAKPCRNISWRLSQTLFASCHVLGPANALDYSQPRKRHSSSLHLKLASKESGCSFRNGGAEDLCPEEAALCALNDLLVDGLWWVVHDDCAGLVVDFCVDARVADEVDDPLFALVLREAKAG
jgi:hypothetical protein